MLEHVTYYGAFVFIHTFRYAIDFRSLLDAALTLPCAESPHTISFPVLLTRTRERAIIHRLYLEISTRCSSAQSRRVSLSFVYFIHSLACKMGRYSSLFSSHWSHDKVSSTVRLLIRIFNATVYFEFQRKALSPFRKASNYTLDLLTIIYHILPLTRHWPPLFCIEQSSVATTQPLYSYACCLHYSCFKFCLKFCYRKFLLAKGIVILQGGRFFWIFLLASGCLLVWSSLYLQKFRD